jgi:DNA-binding transcriptional LysR family regulator
MVRERRARPLRLGTCTSVTVIAELVSAGVGLSVLPVRLIRPRVIRAIRDVLERVPFLEAA